MIKGRRERTDWTIKGLDFWYSELINLCKESENKFVLDYRTLSYAYSEPARIYFSIAARSRAKDCQETERREINSLLYLMRSSLEESLRNKIESNPNIFHDLLYKKGLFGYSIKQGVTVRFPLYTCLPTPKCGALCYAHDGRDKHFSSISRGVFNAIGLNILKESEEAIPERDMLINQIDKAIANARKDALISISNGYNRQPRIRLSHVGEIASLPIAANWLAQKIKERSDSEVTPVIYTRHPLAKLLDTKSVVVNFTIESDNDKRIKFSPPGARIVCSSWSGNISSTAEINFLEHHGRTHHTKTGNGFICPVTSHNSLSSCDEAKCIACFKFTSE